jgi:helix-turn-helix protein
MHDVARPGRGRKPRLVHEEDVFWGHDGTYVDIEGTQDIRQAAMEERGERKPEFVAPGAEQKWRARNLVDIHWALTAIKTPSESYNRVLSCIIDHANPHNGLCYPSQSIIAIETGYSVETVKRAIRWWKKQGFLKTESRGLGHALAYHPQWDLLEGFWVGVMSDIEEQKASRVTKGTYDVGHQGDLREGHQGDLREGHHADLQNLKVEPQTLTPKNEPHPERVISPSVEITTPLEGQIRGKKKRAFRGNPSWRPLPFLRLREGRRRRIPGLKLICSGCPATTTPRWLSGCPTPARYMTRPSPPRLKRRTRGSWSFSMRTERRKLREERRETS